MNETVVSGPAGPTALEAALGHQFRKGQLIQEALTHRSSRGTRGKSKKEIAGSGSYERLEFLGDRVIGLVVAELLLERFPRESEGALARRHADLVRRDTLAAIALELGLPPLIRLPAIEEADARANPSLLSDVCEAVIAALYLDGGFETARAVVRRLWTPAMEATTLPPKDPKTGLQEWAQARALPLPTYVVTATEGPAHQPVFTVEARVEHQEPAAASAPSKRQAEAQAAALLLARLTAKTPA